MFGFRSDGVDISKTLDPIVLFSPLIMPTRCESMNQVTYPAEYEPMANLIRSRKATGHTISFLTIMAAAYVRTIRKYPVMNYFVMGNRIYRHKDITISLVILRDTDDGSFREAVVKVTCLPDDTLLDVARKFDEQVAIAKKPDTDNAAVDFAGRMLRIPVLPWVAVKVLKLCDRMGIMPKKIIEISPFHCSFFITNMMSIGLPSIYHHLYNFGTCSIFLSFGRPERHTVVSGGQSVRKIALPLGFNTDERICGGAEYALAVHMFLNYLQHPELLELTPEEEEARKTETAQWGETGNAGGSAPGPSPKGFNPFGIPYR